MNRLTILITIIVTVVVHQSKALASCDSTYDEYKSNIIEHQYNNTINCTYNGRNIMGCALFAAESASLRNLSTSIIIKDEVIKFYRNVSFN